MRHRLGLCDALFSELLVPDPKIVRFVCRRAPCVVGPHKTCVNPRRQELVLREYSSNTPLLEAYLATGLVHPSFKSRFLVNTCTHGNKSRAVLYPQGVLEFIGIRFLTCM